jgi:transposase-like protein
MTQTLKQQAIDLFIAKGLKKAEISRKLNVPRSTVRRWLIDTNASTISDVEDSPLSETALDKLHSCTKEEALIDLRRLAEAEPEKCITRNYYRVHGKYSESCWNKFFGTFHEFKRQAGIVLTRQQHNLEQKIAKHASVDHYRAMSEERMGYADNYVVKNPSRYKKIVVASDMHDKNIDSFYLTVLLDTLKRVQPDVVVLGGDIFDLPEFGRYTTDPREWDVVGRIKFAHDNILGPIRKICPYAQIDFIEGNHEYRILRHLADATPALKAVLSDLHGMTVSSLLGLDKFKINYIAKGNLATYSLAEQHREVAKNYKIYFDSFLVGHEPMYSNLGFPGISGHHHKTVISSHYNAHFGNYQWVEIGGGHKLDSEYSMSKWNHGFCILTCDTLKKETVFDTITFTQNMAVVGGKVYHR